MVTSQEKSDRVLAIRERIDEHGIYVTELAKEVRRSRWTVHQWMNDMTEKRFDILTAAIDRILERETGQ